MTARARESRPSDAPFLGVGVGLRPVHYPDVLGERDASTLGVDFFEAISENYMVAGGRPPRALASVRERFPLVLHGVSLNIGSTDPLDDAYLARLGALIARSEPAWVTDHLCWTGVARRNLHDLLPLPCTAAGVDHVAERVRRVQDRLGRRIALENPSSYLSYVHDDMPECEFLREIAERADCGILLDVNNVFVSAYNHGFDARAYLDAIPAERVFQIHLAGHSDAGGLLIDTHDHPVRDEVWSLYEHAIRRLGPVSTLIEWDDQIPPFETLVAEAARARAILTRVVREQETNDDEIRARAGACATAAVAAHHGA